MIPILQADVPTSNNRVYPKEVLEAALRDVKLPMMLTNDNFAGQAVPLSSYVGAVNKLEMHDNVLVGDLRFFKEDMQRMWDDGLMVCQIWGDGYLDHQAAGIDKVRSFTIRGVYVQPRTPDFKDKDPFVEGEELRISMECSLDPTLVDPQPILPGEEE